MTPPPWHTGGLAVATLAPLDAHSAPAHRELAHGAHVCGRYRIDGVLGRGGMGVVYAAEDLVTGGHVAIKFMSWGAERDRVERELRFEREVRNAAAVGHRHVVQLLDVGSHAGEPYLVMEYLEGESLEQRLWRDKVLSPQEALAILLPIASALAALHARGVVHRDVKPSNIFLAEDDGVCVPKLLDFGASLTLSEPRCTRTGAVLGTPLYMAPEHAADGSATPQSDLWSLAVVLYECLTGGGPYPSAEPNVLATLVLAGSVLPLRARFPSLPPQLCSAVERGLVRDPRRRCSDMASFAEGLMSAALRDGIPLPAGFSRGAPPGVPEPLGQMLAAEQVLIPPSSGAHRAARPSPLGSAVWVLVLVASTVAALGVGFGVGRGQAVRDEPTPRTKVPAAQAARPALQPEVKSLAVPDAPPSRPQLRPRAVQRAQPALARPAGEPARAKTLPPARGRSGPSARWELETRWD